MLRSILMLAMTIPLAAAAEPEVHTFSIVAFDAKTGELGVAVQSRYFGVGSVVPWAEAGVGAVATQAMAKVSFGPDGLRLLREGKEPEAAIAELTETDRKRDVRQLAIVDAKGRVAAFTGKECLDWAGHHKGEAYTVQGNLLANGGVLKAMAETFEKARAKAEGELADWLVAALQSGQSAGGDRRGQQSAALLVVRERGGPNGENDRYIDLRVEDHQQPITELERLLELHKKFHSRGHREDAQLREKPAR